MRDQAASLRQLKANYDKLVARPKVETTMDFVAHNKRPSPLSAYILVFLDELTASYPQIDKWLPQISLSPNQIYLWDQANLINKGLVKLQNLDNPAFPILPKQLEMLDLPSRSDSERLEFLKNISTTLDNHQEVWITIKASELPYYNYLINSANKLCIMLPDTQDSIIKGYEAVKNIYNLKCSTEINILEFSSKPFLEGNLQSSRIKNVAKQFLGIDLYTLGVVLSSSKYISTKTEGALRDLKSQVYSENCDFMYSFGSSIANLTLGTH